MKIQKEVKFQAIVLAAGKGTRMKSAADLPKVLIPFAGKPMIRHVVSAFSDAGLSSEHIAIVIGYGADQVKRELGRAFSYIFQKEQLGTGHAVSLCEPSASVGEHIIVMYGDHPLVSADTLRTIQNSHLDANATVTMATVSAGDFADWRASFYDFGRVIRDEKGRIVRIIERKDASDEEKLITEVNPSYFCFRADWLWPNIKLLKNNNAQGEYYLTDLIGLACEQGVTINSVIIPAHEALGVNDPVQLAVAEKFFRSTQ